MTDEITRVLFVEAQPGDLEFVQRLLQDIRRFDFEMESARALSAGLKRLSKGTFDVVLLDLGLPESQGLKTFSRAYAEASHTPIIVITGMDDEETAIEAVNQGAQDYLVKGEMTGNLLVRSIHYAIGRNQSEETIRHLNQVLNAIRNVNQLITKEKDRDALIRKACTTIIETRGYYNAWIALVDEEGSFLTSAEAGLGNAFDPMVALLKEGKRTACAEKAPVPSRQKWKEQGNKAVYRERKVCFSVR